MEWRLPKTLAIESVRLRVWRSLLVVLVIAAMIGMVGYMVEFSLPSCVQDAINKADLFLDTAYPAAPASFRNYGSIACGTCC